MLLTILGLALGNLILNNFAATPCLAGAATCTPGHQMKEEITSRAPALTSGGFVAFIGKLLNKADVIRESWADLVLDTACFSESDFDLTRTALWTR